MNNKLHSKVPTCTLCRSIFKPDEKLPCTQACQHSVCSDCLSSIETRTLICPVDGEQLELCRIINEPFSTLLGSRALEEHLDLSKQNIDSLQQISQHLKRLASLVIGDKGKYLSPQLEKKLRHLIQSTCCEEKSRLEFLKRFSSLYNRLLLELIQAHSNTSQREQELKKIIKNKGCILEPNLADSVIELLMQLYKAPGQGEDSFYERKVLVLFLANKLTDKNIRIKEVEKVVQTLYRSECFIIAKLDGATGRLRLKEELCNSVDVREKHDEGLIKLAQTVNPPIRLSPEDWTRLLYRSSHPETISRIQSLLDRHTVTPTAHELKQVISKMGDKYKILDNLDDLQQLGNRIESLMQSSVGMELGKIAQLVESLALFEFLFVLRQCRGQRHYN